MNGCGMASIVVIQSLKVSTIGPCMISGKEKATIRVARVGDWIY